MPASLWRGMMSSVGRAPSEVFLGLHEELHPLDTVVPVERECQVHVHDVAEARAGVAEAQAEACVLQQPEARSGQRRAAPGPAAVKEDSSPHTEQPERVPVGEKALLHSPQGACRAILVTQGIAAKPIVA